VVLLVPVFLWSSDVGAQAPRTAIEFALNRTAKILCSGVFVSGRDVRETLRNSARRVLAPDAFARLANSDPDGDRVIEVDRGTGLTSVTLDGYTARARYYGDQGCAILPAGYDDVFFQPVSVRSSLPDAATMDWPMGDRLPDGPFAEDVDGEKLEEAVAEAFTEGGLTAAFLVVHRGRIVAERYGPGTDLHTQLESWSMGKSLTATLIGVLAQQGRVGLDDPAPISEWRRDPDDPRARIRIRDLLRMSSGLRFSHAEQPRHEWGREIPDHLFIYADGIDALHFSITRPVQHPPNTVGRYRNVDPILLGGIARRIVEGDGDTWLDWPQRALFDRIGIRRQVMETDPYGNFLLPGHDFGTARNWARLGLLYVQDGVWNGERVLPEGWTEFVTTPAPAWEEPEYGGLFWLNRAGRFEALPPSAYWMSGAGGQSVIIVPTHDLVVVRMGHADGAGVGGQALRRALFKVMEAMEGPRGL